MLPRNVFDTILRVMPESGLTTQFEALTKKELLLLKTSENLRHIAANSSFFLKILNLWMH